VRSSWKGKAEEEKRAEEKEMRAGTTGWFRKENRRPDRTHDYMTP